MNITIKKNIININVLVTTKWQMFSKTIADVYKPIGF